MVYAIQSTLTIDRNQAKKQLELLGYKPGDNVYMRFFVPDGDPRHGTPAAAKKANKLNWDELERYQNDGYGVYFVINGGGHADKDVQRGRSLFCEWDDRPIEDQIFAWQSLKLLEPTMQIGTRKSVHNYWRADLTKDQWIELQQDLLVYTQSDQKLKNPSRVLRLAGCWHIKPGCDPIRCDIIHQSDKVYTYEELRAAIPRRQKPEQPTINYQSSISDDVPLYQLLTKDDRTLIDQGAAQGSRNSSGAKLARNLIGTAHRLNHLGIRFVDDPRHLFHDYCYRCAPSLSTREAETIWKSALKDNPTASLTDEALSNCAKAWLRNQEKASGRSFSGGIGSGGGNRRGNGGAGGSGGGDGGDRGDGGGKVIKHPSFLSISPEELEARLDALIQEGLSSAKLTNRLNHLASETGRHVIELRKQYLERLDEVEREEGREDTQSQVDALIDASRASVSLREVLPSTLAEPLLKLAGWLNLKPECYLTALLTTTSILHKAGTKVVLNKEWDFEVTPNLYSAIIAASSQKKSPIIKAICTKPLKVLQREALKEYKQQLEIYEGELKEWEATKPDERGQPPVKPERKIYFFTKTTGEGLTYQAARCPEQGMLYLTDELAGMLNAQNQYRGGKGSDKQDLLSYYDGSGDVVLRAEGVKSENDFILLGLLGGIQPKIMQKLLDDCSDSDGGWARFMFVNQPNAASRMNSDGGKYDLSDLLSDLYRRIDALPPTEYRLSPKAFRLFCKAYNRMEELRTSDRLEGMQSVWGKSEGRIGKLAVNLHVIHALMNGETPTEEIPVEMVRIAIDLTKFYAQQVQSLYTQFSDPDALAPQLVKVIELSRNKGWLKASDVYLSITKKQRPSGETVREWFGELVVMGKGEVKGQGRSLQFRAFLPNEPPPSPPLDEIRQILDKSSNGETTIYQEVQEKLDKLDDLDDFQKRAMDVQVIEVRGHSTTGLGKNSVLDELSNLSNSVRNALSGGDTALDESSNKSSKLDDLVTEEAIAKRSSASQIAPSSPIHQEPEATEAVPDDQTHQQAELPIYQQSDGGFAIESSHAHVTEQPTPVEQKVSTSADKSEEAANEEAPSATVPDIWQDACDRSDVELKRLGWTPKQGKNYLLQTYGKRSRILLSDAEMLDFLRYLQGQPNLGVDDRGSC